MRDNIHLGQISTQNVQTDEMSLDYTTQPLKRKLLPVKKKTKTCLIRKSKRIELSMAGHISFLTVSAQSFRHCYWG